MGEDAGRRRLAVHDGDLGNHAFNGRLLVFAAERHEDRTGADSAVEPFGKALFGGDVEGAHRVKPRFGDVRYFRSRKEIFVFRSRDEGLASLSYAVRIEEGSRDVDDILAAPVHDEALRIRRNGDDRRFEVFFSRIFHEFVDVFRRDDNGHAFLRFGNSQFRAVEAFVFLRNLVEVDVEAVGQFTDSNGDAAGAEVVAALDEDRHFVAAEEALDFPFCQGVALLDFSSARFQGFDSVLLRRARRAAAAVAAGLAAEKDDDVAGDGRFADDVVPRRCAEDCADFHALRYEALVIIFLNFARRQADLVAVGAVALGRAGRQRALGQLAFERILDGLTGIAGAGNAHSLVYVGAAAQGIADAAPQAGCRTAEGFDFRRMVMGFIFKQEKPFFFHAVDVDGDDDGAGIDFVRFVEILELAGSLQLFDGDGRHVHEGLGFLAVQVFPRRLVRFIGPLNRSGELAVFKGDVRQFRHKRRMAAVVGPVRIDDADFRYRRIPLFFFAKIGLAELQVVEAHGKAHVRRQFLQRGVVHRRKAFDDGDVCRLFPGHFQGIYRIEGRFAGFDGVDAVMLDSGDVFVGQGSRQNDDPGGADEAVVLHRQHLQALHGRVGALVVLTGQVFDSQHRISFFDRQFIVYGVYRGLGENHGFRRFEGGVVQTGYVVAVEYVNIGQPLDKQVFL